MKTPEKSPYKIYLDSSDRKVIKIKLYKDEESKSELVGEVVGDLDITSSIKHLLEKNKLTVEDVEIVEPNKGPGSFTGLKMGITVSNILNWALKRKKSSELDYPEYGSEPNITLPKKS